MVVVTTDSESAANNALPIPRVLAGQSSSKIIGVVLGASRFPLMPKIDDEQMGAAFEQSKQEVTSWLLSYCGEVYDLFDLGETPDTLGRMVNDFLRSRKESTSAVVVYYVGHGSFLPRSQEYFLACRALDENAVEWTAFRVASLAASLSRHMLTHATFILLDCCFAAAAAGFFQAGESDVIRAQAEDYPAGVALLAAASKNKAARVPEGGSRTMFADGLLSVLAEVKPGSQLSLRELCARTADFISTNYPNDAVRPEVHSPRQTKGDIADIPMFPSFSRHRDGNAPSRESPLRMTADINPTSDSQTGSERHLSNHVTRLQGIWLNSLRHGRMKVFGSLALLLTVVFLVFFVRSSRSRADFSHVNTPPASVGLRAVHTVQSTPGTPDVAPETPDVAPEIDAGRRPVVTGVPTGSLNEDALEQLADRPTALISFNTAETAANQRSTRYRQCCEWARECQVAIQSGTGQTRVLPDGARRSIEQARHRYNVLVWSVQRDRGTVIAAARRLDEEIRQAPTTLARQTLEATKRVLLAETSMPSGFDPELIGECDRSYRGLQSPPSTVTNVVQLPRHIGRWQSSSGALLELNILQNGRKQYTLQRNGRSITREFEIWQQMLLLYDLNDMNTTCCAPLSIEVDGSALILSPFDAGVCGGVPGRGGIDCHLEGRYSRVDQSDR